MDRLNLQIEVASLTSEERLAASEGEPSSDVLPRVLAARAIQHNRGWMNAQLPPPLLQQHTPLDRDGRRLVADAVDRGGMSARAVRCKPQLGAPGTIDDHCNDQHEEG
jgi:magnesium chelatase family protein